MNQTNGDGDGRSRGALWANKNVKERVGQPTIGEVDGGLLQDTTLNSHHQRNITNTTTTYGFWAVTMDVQQTYAV